MKKYPLVSFVVLNWNGLERLKKCLLSVYRVKYPNKEVVLVNNGSTDNSGVFVKKNYPKIRLIELKENVGYAKGKNIGVSKAKGKYVLALDNDTEVASSFLYPLVKDLEEDSSIGIVQPQIRSMAERKLLDSVIAFLTFTGFLYYVGHSKSYSKKFYNKRIFGYSIKGACFLMRKKDYINLGGLDESFISYVEETDLCHRIWISGKKVLYDPGSYIYHYGGGDTQIMEKTDISLSRSFRNRIVSYIKNFSLVQLIKILPVHILFCEMVVLGFIVKLQFKKAMFLQGAIFYPFFHLKPILKKRNFIQNKIRKVTDNTISGFIFASPRPSYYWYAFAKDDLRDYKD